MLSVPPADYIGSASASRNDLFRDGHTLKFVKFPLTRAASLVVYVSRETAGPVPSAESVFFSGPTGQFSAVDDCLRLGFAVYGKDDL